VYAFLLQPSQDKRLAGVSRSTGVLSSYTVTQQQPLPSVLLGGARVIASNLGFSASAPNCLAAIS